MLRVCLLFAFSVGIQGQYDHSIFRRQAVGHKLVEVFKRCPKDGKGCTAKCNPIVPVYCVPTAKNVQGEPCSVPSTCPASKTRYCPHNRMTLCNAIERGLQRVYVERIGSEIECPEQDDLPYVTLKSQLVHYMQMLVYTPDMKFELRCPPTSVYNMSAIEITIDSQKNNYATIKHPKCIVDFKIPEIALRDAPHMVHVTVLFAPGKPEVARALFTLVIFKHKMFLRRNRAIENNRLTDVQIVMPPEIDEQFDISLQPTWKGKAVSAKNNSIDVQEPGKISVSLTQKFTSCTPYFSASAAVVEYHEDITQNIIDMVGNDPVNTDVSLLGNHMLVSPAPLPTNEMTVEGVDHNFTTRPDLEGYESEDIMPMWMIGAIGASLCVLILLIIIGAFIARKRGQAKTSSMQVPDPRSHLSQTQSCGLDRSKNTRIGVGAKSNRYEVVAASLKSKTRNKSRSPSPRSGRRGSNEEQ